MREILKLEHVNTKFPSKDGAVNAVCDVNMTISEGEIVALVGETGCGKSVLGQSILRLLPGYAITSGNMMFEGENLLGMSEKELRNVRGKRIAYINQNPSEALNPVLKIGTQLKEAIKCCGTESSKACMAKAEYLLESLSFKDPKAVMEKYPNELSGGMKQRVMVAMAMSGEPSFMIADEPTKGLDPLIRAQVIDSFRKFIEITSCAGIIITHDLKFAQSVSNKTALMYAGEIIEYGETKEMFDMPMHPYFKGLISSMPQNGMNVLQGNSCSLINLPENCRFRDRCGEFCNSCLSGHPSLIEAETKHMVRCWKFAQS